MSSNSIFINISDCRTLTKNRNIINNPIKFYEFIISYGKMFFQIFRSLCICYYQLAVQ